MSCSLPDTLTPLMNSLTPDTRNLLQQPPPVWGKLLPTISTMRKFDLEKPTFLLGRDPSCDVVISEQTVPRQLANISKKHFRIEQSSDNLIIITDLSKNGTYLNGKLIGANNQCILQNDDEIAISFRGLRVYVFKSIVNSDLAYLPIGLRRKYEVSKVLGEGACGEVRLVFEKYTCRAFACKRIMKCSGSKRKFNRPDNIKKEVDILKQLKHPFIISIIEVEETPSAYYIIMEYMEGGELSYLIQSPKRLSEFQVKSLFYQIAVAVQYLHDMNVTHRDLKPENILLKNDTKDNNTVKISDFGLSKMLSQQSMMKTLCGTPSFAAPEIFDPSTTTYGRKVDVWSLGVILYYMFTQELPFRASTSIALRKVILTGKYSMNNPVWSELSKPAKDLVGKMLVCDPKQRIGIDQVIDHLWFAEDEPLRIRVEDMVYRNFETRQLEPDSDVLEDSQHRSKRIKLSPESDETIVD